MGTTPVATTKVNYPLVPASTNKFYHTISVSIRHYLMAGEENVGSKPEEDLDDLFMTFPGCLHYGSPPSLENGVYELSLNGPAD